MSAATSPGTGLAYGVNGGAKRDHLGGVIPVSA